MTYAIVVLSGGMDSTVALHHTRLTADVTEAVSFDYGQRHRVELDRAAATCDRLDVGHHIVDLSGLAPHLTGSALTDDTVEVPHGHYADESMRATVVPNRNAILLNVAAGIAAANGADTIVTGVHAGDHPIYPDCRPEFIDDLTRMLATAMDGYAQVRVDAPFVHIGKHDIVRLGDAYGVDWSLTWSCYEGGDVHCGQCGTCVERIEAFDLAGIIDPTTYRTEVAA